MFSSRSATWYHYDYDNILKGSTTQHPLELKSEICKHLNNYFRQLRFKMKLPDRDAENYKEQSEHFCRAISTIGKTIKLVGSGAFSDSVMSFLRGFSNRDDIGHVLDRNQNVIAFSNGYFI